MLGSLPQVDRDVTFHDYIPGQPIPILIRDKKTGRVVVNELKRYVKPYTLVTEPEEITLAANAVSDPIIMPIDNKGHFEIMEAFFKSQQPEGFTVMLFDPAERPLLMNREVHVATIASGGGVTTDEGAFGTGGSAGRPFKWPCSFFMDVWDSSKPGAMIVAFFRNLSSSQNTIRFAFHGLRWYHLQSPPHIYARMQEIYRDRPRTMPFFYTTEKFVELPASTTIQSEFDVRFSDDGWTHVSKLMARSTSDFLVRIKEKASQKRYMDLHLPSGLVFGNGEFPFLCWEPSLYEPNYKLAFELINGTAAATNVVWITLATQRIWIDPREDRLASPRGYPA